MELKALSEARLPASSMNASATATPTTTAETAATAPATAVTTEEAAADSTAAPTDLTTPAPAVPMAASKMPAWVPPAPPAPPPPPEDADMAPLLLRSAEGHLFEVPPRWLWRSPIIRDLAQDGDVEQEIPLPKASTSAVESFLSHCEMYPAFPTGHSLRSLCNATNDVLSDILWILKALDIYSVMLPAFVDLLSEREEVLELLYSDILIPLVGYLGMHSADISSNFPLRAVFRRLAHCPRLKQHPERTVDSLRPFLAHPTEEWRNAALEAMLSMEVFEAKVLLLQHRDFLTRSRVCRSLSDLPHDEAHIGVLRQYLASSSFELRELTVKAIARVAPSGCQLAIDIFIGCLTDMAREVREAVVESFPKLVLPDDQATVAKVMKYAVDTTYDWPTRACALAVLAVIAPSKADILTDMASQMQVDAPTMYKLRATRVLERLAPEPLPDTADSSGSGSGSSSDDIDCGRENDSGHKKQPIKERNQLSALGGKDWAEVFDEED
eukprot:CAMPEP_0206449736 /NCGR_PEP_ID=MMETSP0324_2-20121206/18283_1 /ASSEMBLY_ACC=CAM_ASM_000836 /TAXON_ID=2866 /ORGANISM="Crypthecodinium cohnii, Strain Seligo" /LENGTH=497 /DNA_ID=CAMNT_0053919203 /DNA_START=251 /DNA_END=1744 /DNA_ORIENTATION=-